MTKRADIIERLAIAGASRALRSVGKAYWKTLTPQMQQAWRLDANLMLLRIQRAGLRITLSNPPKRKAKR